MLKNTKKSIDSIFYISAVYSYQTLTDYIKEYRYGQQKSNGRPDNHRQPKQFC